MTTAKLHIIHSFTMLLSNLHIYKLYWQQLGATSQQSYKPRKILNTHTRGCLPLRHPFSPLKSNFVDRNNVRSGPCIDLFMYRNGPCSEMDLTYRTPKSTVYHKNVPIWSCTEMDMYRYGRYPSFLVRETQEADYKLLFTFLPSINCVIRVPSDFLKSRLILSSVVFASIVSRYTSPPLLRTFTTSWQFPRQTYIPNRTILTINKSITHRISHKLSNINI